MLVSHKHRFIYIKTRKTASTSIEGLLEPLCAPEGHVARHVQPFLASEYGLIAGRAGAESKEDPLSAHSPAEHILQHLGRKTFRSYLKVYCVRDPYDKVVSWFWHVMPSDLRAEMSEDFDATRKLFRAWLQMRPTLPTDRNYYSTRSHGPIKAHVIHYERMHEDLAALADILGVTLDLDQLPRWKTQSRRHKDVELADYYDDATREVVRTEFRFDFKNFGYAP